MTARQKEMAAIKEQIKKLEERIEYLSKLPDTTLEDELLCSLEDFPLANIKNFMYQIKREKENRLMAEGAEYEERNMGRGVTCKFLKNSIYMEDLTVKDLIACNEKKISSWRCIGKVRMEALKNWMEKYDLHFLG